MDPYAYVGDNPETRNDPSGHCWPLCTMIIGALVGAAISVATTVVSNAVQGKPTSLGEIAQSAVVGAVSGAVAGLAGPEAGPVAKMAIGALSAGAGQMASNAMSGKPLMDGVGQAALIGGVTGGAMQSGGEEIEGIAEDGENALADAGGSCGLSFRADTPVETPTGEQPIGTLHVGDHVQAYNPTTKTVSTQTVQQVFINHDTDLIDVTLAVQPAHTQSKAQQVAVVSHGSHAPPVTTEVVHTTQKHPWLTTKGWITAGQLHVGDHVQQLDGSTATVVGLKIIVGSASMYDLTVSNVHTFAVGDGQFVVHNCGDGLPDRVEGDPTRGVLADGDNQIDVMSDKNGPGKQEMLSNTPGFDKRLGSWFHAEGNAAAIMRQNGIKDATLYLNNTPCGSGGYGCTGLLPHMLPEGSTLTVLYKDAVRGITDWATQVYTGLSDSEWQNSIPYRNLLRFN